MKNLIQFQMFYPIPIFFGWFIGDDYIKNCMIVLGGVCVTIVVMSIMVSQIHKLNDVFHYNLLIWTQMGICFIGFSFILFRIRYRERYTNLQNKLLKASV